MRIANQFYLMPAPNRYRKINRIFLGSHEDQTAIIKQQRVEFVNIKGIPFGLGYSFSICDEVLVWFLGKEYQMVFGEENQPNIFV